MASQIENKAVKIEMVKVSELVPHPKNPNQHSDEQIGRLCEIIKYQGFRDPLIVSTRSGFIVSGHGRLMAAKKLGIEEVPVTMQDFEDDDQEYAAIVSENSIASWAELDLSSINAQIPEFDPSFNIDLLGIKDFVLEPAEKFQRDEDDVPEPQNPIVKSGELYILGEHRLLCGDSTDATQVERLMNGQKADMVFTDPPYGISLESDNKKRTNKNYRMPDGRNITPKTYRPVRNDEFVFDPGLILNTFRDSREMFLWGANNYGHLLPPGTLHGWFVWDKKGSESMDKSIAGDFEICFSLKTHKVRMVRIAWNGPFGHVRKDDGDFRVHPTQKPVRLPVWFFKEYGKEADLVVDLYLGSGSTLIACEKTNRKCYGMEIDPIYCGVILDRFEKFSGKKAMREDGKLWQDIKNEA